MEPKTPHFLSLDQNIAAMTLKIEEVKGDYLDICKRIEPGW
jgi:hypothetical protein